MHASTKARLQLHRWRSLRLRPFNAGLPSPSMQHACAKMMGFVQSGLCLGRRRVAGSFCEQERWACKGIRLIHHTSTMVTITSFLPHQSLRSKRLYNNLIARPLQDTSGMICKGLYALTCIHRPLCTISQLCTACTCPAPQCAKQGHMQTPVPCRSYASANASLR